MYIGHMISNSLSSETVVFPAAFFPRLVFIFLSWSLSTLVHIENATNKMKLLDNNMSHLCNTTITCYQVRPHDTTMFSFYHLTLSTLSSTDLNTLHITLTDASLCTECCARL